MITSYIVGLFILAAISVYSLIVSRTNRLLVFLLVPSMLVMSLFTWKVILELQGTPIKGYPIDERIEIIYIYKQKPEIMFLAKKEGENIPTYYIIPWTEENAQKMAVLERIKEMGVDVEGKFKEAKNGHNSQSNSIYWEQTSDFIKANPKNKPKVIQEEPRN